MIEHNFQKSVYYNIKNDKKSEKYSDIESNYLKNNRYYILCI